MLRFFKKKKDTSISLIKDSAQGKAGHFHQLTVSDVNRETPECVSVAFALTDDLREKYKFLPGQYLTFKFMEAGEEIRRSYSICASPYDGELRVAIKEVPGGAFSTHANRSLKVGDVLDVMMPMGNFILEPNANAKNQYVAFAAGSGITPIMSIIKSVLQGEPNSSFLLFYGNRSSATIIFKDALDDLKNEYLNRLEVHHILSREDQGSDLLFGRIDGTKVSSCAAKFFTSNAIAAYYLCGPAEMISDASQTLESLGVDKKKVHFELFTSAGVADKVDHLAQKTSAKILSSVTIILDGEETHFDVSSTGKTVLDAALDAGADVPFACKGAVCCTCRAKIIEGSAEMEMNYALMDDEVADGYILTCQSHPTSPKLVVSYDA